MPTCRGQGGRARGPRGRGEEFRPGDAANPNNRDYALALIVTREHRVTELVQQAAKQRQLGNNQRAEDLLDRHASSTRTTP